jgi:zinc protease
MLAQFKRLGDSAVSANELAARKATLIGSYGRRLETTSGLAQQVAELAIYRVNLQQIDAYIARVQAVTPAEIEAYAHTYLGRDGTKVVVVGDSRQFAAAIRKTHSKAELLEASALDLDSPQLRAPSRVVPRQD